MKNLLSLLMFIACLPASASDRIGNGGDVLVCPGKVELLDVYSAREELKLTLKENQGRSSYQAILNSFLENLRLVNPTRATNYHKWLATFELETERVSGKTLVDIPDTGAQSIPAGCRIEQVAVQREENDRLPGQKRYMINQDLWAQMNEFNRAALVLHELVYRERLAISPKNSQLVRYFTAHLISENLPALDYRKLVIFSRLNSYDEKSVPVSLAFSEGHLYPTNSPVVSWFFSARERAVSGLGFGFDQLENRSCTSIALTAYPDVMHTWNFLFAQVSGCGGASFNLIVQVGNNRYIANFDPIQPNVLMGEARLGAAGVLLTAFSIPELNFTCPAGYRLDGYQDRKNPNEYWVGCPNSNGSPQRVQVAAFGSSR